MTVPDRNVKWYYQPWILIPMLFLFLGPLGLPLVFKSPKLGKTAKIILTVLMAAYTWYLAVAMLEITKTLLTEYSRLKESLVY